MSYKLFTCKYFEIYTPQVCALLLCEKEAIQIVKILILISGYKVLLYVAKKKKFYYRN